MSTTTNLGLFKHDNVATNTDPFDLLKSINDNLDKIDAEIGSDRKDIQVLQQRLAEKDEQIADLNNNQIHGQANGEYVHLVDSANMNCDIAVCGNSKQETRSGKNLLKNTATTQTVNGVDFTVNEDGTVTANGTATNTSYIAVNSFSYVANQDYVLSGCPNSGSDNTYKMYSINTSTGAGHTNDYGEGGAIKVSADQVGEIRIRIASGYTANNLVFKPMLVAGTENKEYEQYGVMPSLDYPSEIQCVGDNVNVLDFINYQSFTANNAYLAIKANGFNLKANIDYIFSYSADGDFSTSNALKLWFRDANNSNFKEVLANITFSLTEEELNKLSYIQVVIQGITKGNIYSGHIYAKIEKGKKATAYSTYGYGNVNVKVCNKNTLVNNLKNQTVNGITLTKNDDGSVLVNGTATATTSFIIAENVKINKQTKLSGCPSSGGFNKFVLQALFDGGSSIDVGLGATIKDEIEYVTIRILIYNGVTVNNEVFYPQIEEGTATDYIPHEEQNYHIDIQEEMLEGDYFDLENGKEVHNWQKIESYNGEEITTEYKSTTGQLSTGATVYYKLAEPRKLDLTETQKTQLQALQKAKTYKNITNITTDTIAVLDVDYKRDLETIINNMQAQILAG